MKRSCTGSLWFTSNVFLHCDCAYIVPVTVSDFLVLYFLLWKSVEGITPPQLDTNPINVQDLRENVKLTLTCTFRRILNFDAREIVVMQGNDTQTTSLGVLARPTVKGLEQATTKYSSNVESFEYTVELVTKRTLNNLTFSCLGVIDNGSELIRFSNTSQPLNIKCKIAVMLILKVNVIGDKVYVV